MPTEIEEIPVQSNIDALRRAIQKLHRDEEVDYREVDSLVLEETERRGVEGNAARGISTGLNATLATVWEDLDEEDVRLPWIRKRYFMGRAWQDEWIEGATYGAHEELAAAKWDGRREGQLKKLVSRSRTGRVNRDDVRRWKSGEEKPKYRSWEAKFERRVRSLLSGKDGPATASEWRDAERIISRVFAELKKEATDEREA